MNTRRQTLTVVSVFLAIMIIGSVPAQAGLLDWFSANHAKADTASTGSFDAFYASMFAGAPVNDEAVVMHAAFVAATSPTTEATLRKVTQRTYTVQVSGYNSEVAQTDDSPFITASGTHVRDGIVASNMFPFGTVLKIPSLYGDKIFVVEDRMNSRYQHNVDIWFTSKTDALKLGRRTVQIQVLQ